MSTLRIHRTDQISCSLEFHPETPILADEFLERMKSLFTTFKGEQRILQERLNFSLSSICLDRRNKEILAFMEKRFLVPLTEEQMVLIFKIASFIKTQSVFSLGIINRYKIDGLCSISILSTTNEPSLDDKIFIHLKKKETCLVLGKGSRSKAFKALEFSQRQFSWVAEKTTYRLPVKNLNSGTLQLNPALFINPPFFSYFYYQEKQKAEACEIEKKHCSLEPLFDLSLIEILEAHQNLSFLTEKSIWSITTQLIEMIKELHDKNLIYRDLKPDNILVSLDKSSSAFSFNKFSLVAADLDTVTQENVDCERWYGTPSYFPKDQAIEKQGKPYDIYVLGQILSGLFVKSLDAKFYIFDVFKIIAKMKSEDFRQRPTIEDVQVEFLSLRPRYLFLTEETIDCISFKDCVIS